MKKLCNFLCVLYLIALVLILGVDQTSRADFPLLALMTTFSILLFAPLAVIAVYALWDRSWVSGSVLFAGIVLFLATHPIFPQKTLLATEALSSTFEVMTFNTGWNHTPANQIKSILQNQEADFVSIQEATSEQQELFNKHLNSQFPHQIFDPEQYGIGLLSKHPIIEQSWLQPPTNGRLILHARVDIRGQAIDVFVVHFSLPSIHFDPIVGLPIGLNEYWQAVEINFVLEQAKSAGGPVLMMGDFNMSDQSHTYKDLTAHFGDAFRDVGWGLGFSFPHQQSYNFEQAGLVVPLPHPIVRIDYIFYDEQLKVVGSQVKCLNEGSDHCAMVAKFGLS
ncbi:MAG: endonuclease/exonuclease/phosphatase family protein [Chloroflexota bacterium]